MANSPTPSLSLFHPKIREWFRDTVGTPTDIQERAWPAIARGEHLLATAPTGSGKTLCAFLWAINKLITGEWAAGETRVLYVSPLKALNTDIRLNLLRPLGQLTALFGAKAPRIHVHTRSGDTSAEDRRRTQRQHPEILITTPESLSILLTSAGGESLLRGLTTVILDEIHAVAGTKRGTHLIASVERLARLSGEIQRIALSATVKPLGTIADFVGGYRMQGSPSAPAYLKRPVTVLASPAPKEYVIDVRSAPEATEEELEHIDQAALERGENIDPVWPPLVRELRSIIERNKSTLIFTNSRRHAEKVAYLLNEGQDHQIAYAHHGSLSREVRAEVEQKLKAGELAAIVATSSLELGIDIGELDEVLLIQAPFSVASMLQRVGRAGHSVGHASRGTVFPIHGMDFVAAAVTAQAAREGAIEETRPLHAPLDVLAQLIVSLTARESWKLAELHAFVRTASPYHDLKREHFDLVVEMLAGRYADTRLRALRPLCSVDRVDGTITARDGAAMLIYFSGGTIPDRGYYTLRTADTKARLGELDEEFVFERSVGDRFMLGTQAWRILKIDFQNVEVVPSAEQIGMTPFWKAEGYDRSFDLSQRLGLALEAWNQHLDQTGGEDILRAELRDRYRLDDRAASRVVELLLEQRDATRAATPHRRHLVVERTENAAAGESRQIILHTLWGGRVNRPIALALAAAWQERNGSRIECFADNDGIMLLAPGDLATEEILGLLDPDRLRPLLRTSLEPSGVFGARFRENAARALLLPRDARKRMPLWLTRQRSKKLMDAVMSTPDFPILLETWKTCLEEEMDLDSTALVLDEIRSGAIRVTDVKTRSPSPFASGLAYQQTNKAMYQGDELEGKAVSRLSDDLIRDFLTSSHLSLALSPDLIAGLEAKLRRTATGYTPDGERELLDWVVERLAIPQGEWEELLGAVRRDGGEPEVWIEELGGKLVTLTLPGATTPVVVALESRPRLESAVSSDDELSPFIAEWIRFYGPFPATRLAQVFGLSAERVESVVAELRESRELVLDLLRAGSHEPELCDAENLEILLRMRRAAARPRLEALPAQALPLYLASWQGLCRKGSDGESLKRVLDKLFGFPVPAELWETEVLPARLDPYYPSWLDGLLSSSALSWFGCGKQRSSFAFAEDLELYTGKTTAASPGAEDLEGLFPDPRGRYSFWDLLDRVSKAAGEAGGSASARLSAELWDLVWKGRVGNDSYETLRRGIRTNYTADEPARDRSGRGPRVSRDRWSATRPSTGSWYILSRGTERERDPVEQEEIRKDRIRQLLERYGIVYRELTDHELAAFAWREVFRTLRIMELGGEVTSGHFFHGPQGPQFASFAALRALEQGLPEDAVYWMCAVDPASPCGGRVPGLDLPPRVKSTHLVFEGRTLRLVSRRGGREVDIHAPADHPRLEEFLTVFKHMVGRHVDPENTVGLERVNNTAAATSPYAPAFLRLGFTRDYKRLLLRASV